VAENTSPVKHPLFCNIKDIPEKIRCYLKDGKKQFTHSNKHNSYVQKT
jgi:hypothetical protein